MPYKKVLPKELYKDLLKTYLNLHPDSKPSNKSKPRMTKKIKKNHIDDDDDFIDLADDDQNQNESAEVLIPGSRKRKLFDFTVEKKKQDFTVRRKLATSSCVKRKLSPFNSFVKSELFKVRAENPDLDHKAAFRLVAENWKNIPNNPKANHFSKS
ncbi:hypothetical protein C1645_748720 [Glomus cerebriforme]|uniref:HMG box domain-containing protein n=1 Tax=Glomus cerebriforme TaxID=658196 RepID=A0A397TQP1_9GLOM|nr:hypothetical protein C1645_748720 [Glomus cerebriforme]